MKKIKEVLFMSLGILALAGCSTKSIVQENTLEDDSDKLLVGFSNYWFEEQDFKEEYITEDGESYTTMNMFEVIGDYGYVLTPSISSGGWGYGTDSGNLTSGTVMRDGNPIYEDTDGIFVIDAELHAPSYEEFNGISCYLVYWNRKTGMFSVENTSNWLWNDCQKLSFSHSSKKDNVFHETILNISLVYQYEFADKVTVREYNDADELISTTEINDIYKYKAKKECSYVIVDKELTCYSMGDKYSLVQEIEEYKSFESVRINRKDASEKKTIYYWIRKDDTMKKNSLWLSFLEE